MKRFSNLLCMERLGLLKLFLSYASAYLRPVLSLLFTNCRSVDQSYPTLQHHGLRHTRLPCPSLSPRVCSNSCPLSRWCHSTVSSSVIPFSSCLQSFPASGSFPVSWLLASSGQRIGVSASASVLPVNTQDWSPLGCTGWTSLQSKGLLRVFSSSTVQSINSSVLSFLCSPTLTSVHDY